MRISGCTVRDSARLREREEGRGDAGERGAIRGRCGAIGSYPIGEFGSVDVLHDE